MARVLVVSRNAAMAMGLSATEHEVVDLRPPAFQRWMDTGDRDFDALVLDLDEPVVALDAVTALRARALLAPALLVSSDRPGWDSVELRHLPAAQVLPLPISRPALLSALEDLLGGAGLDDADTYLSVEPDLTPVPASVDDIAPIELSAEEPPVEPADIDPAVVEPAVEEPQAAAAPTDETEDDDSSPAGADEPSLDRTEPGPVPLAPVAVAPDPPRAPSSPGPAPHVSADPWPDGDDDSLLGDEPEEAPRRGMPVTAAALTELHADEDDLDEVEAVPVVAPHDYQRELGLSSRPELPVALAPAVVATAAAAPEVNSPVEAPAQLRTVAPQPPRPAPKQRAKPKETRPVEPPTTEPHEPGAKPARSPGRTFRRRDKPERVPPAPDAARGLGATLAAQPKSPPAPAVAAGASAAAAAAVAADATGTVADAGQAAPAAPLDSMALVQRLLEHVDDLYAVPETADVVVADAVERARAEAGALMIPDDGAWRVSGGVNLRSLEQRYELRADSWLVLEIARGRKGAIVEDSDIARQPLQGAPLASWKHLVAMPIPHVDGLLLLARSTETFDESDLEALAGLVDEAGPLLAQAVDVRRLARALGPYRDDA